MRTAMELTLFTLLHLLVFVYWLGGDVGVFYASTLLTDEKRDAAGRLAAGKIVADVDLAPRFCLLLALPTGLALAAVKGWMQIDAVWLVAAFIAAFAWIYLVVQLHIRHAGMEAMKRLDTVLRALFLAGLAIAGIGGLIGVFSIPLFVSLKLLILAFAVLMGLLVRIALAPFGPAYIALATNGPDPDTDRIIKTSLNRARPAVVMIWLALLLAAWLGLATPI